MERAAEDRERIGAEYAFLAVITTTSSGGVGPRTEAYKSRITNAETRLSGLESSLAEATDDVGNSEHAEEMSWAEREMHELRMSEATALLEEERLRMRSSTGASRRTPG